MGGLSIGWLSGSGAVKAVVVGPEVFPTLWAAATDPADLPVGKVTVRLDGYRPLWAIAETGVGVGPVVGGRLPHHAFHIHLQEAKLWVTDDQVGWPSGIGIAKDFAAFPGTKHGYPLFC